MSIFDYRQLAEVLFSDIYQLSFDGVGVSRASFGLGESAAGEYLSRFAKNEGLIVHTDRAANIIFSQAYVGENTPAIWVGSHIDSVPQGGNFDGLAGVIAGLIILVASQRENRKLSVPMKVVALRGEESAWFGRAYMGSSAIFGRLTPEDLERKQRVTGETLGRSLEKLGADVTAIRNQQVLVEKKNILGWLELHIEQGPVLVEKALPLAVVSGIRGNIRYNHIHCIGDAQHSGAVPRELRHDAVYGVSDLIMRLDVRWKSRLSAGEDLVVTTGIFQTDSEEHAVSRIPGHVSFSLEARSLNTDILKAFSEDIFTEVQAVSQARGVKFIFDSPVFTAPATLDDTVLAAIKRSCHSLSVKHLELASGAGHDSANFANQGIPTGMLFVRNQNGSHNPHEAMNMDDFMQGIRVIKQTIENWV
ncbi:hydantoinase/carbamoylase family amidase [Xenorhabdus stockiae]|uniref:hydantoinase/carbamoylase family amidase n=1 Tax=Xenorhabdus stockiae TaxID=351614 RepID=UPI00406324C7